MTGPRIYPDNTAVSRTPRPTKGLGDLLKKILYDNPKANIASLRDPVDPATIDDFLMQAGMGSVGSMGKVGGRGGKGLPASLKRILGIGDDVVLDKDDLEHLTWMRRNALSKAKRGKEVMSPFEEEMVAELLERQDPNDFARELNEDYFLAKRAGKGQGGGGFSREYEHYLGGAPPTPRVREMLRKKGYTP